MPRITVTPADAGNPIPVVAGIKWDVIGTSAVETYDIAAGAEAVVTTGGGEDVIRMAGAPGDYTVKTVGSSAVFTHTATGKTVTVPMNTAGDQISFAGGTAVALKIDTSSGTAVLQLGTQTLSTTDSAVTGASGGTGPTGEFTLTATASSFDEGSSMTYTVKAAAPVEAATTFTWSLSGVGTNQAGAADFSTATSGTVTIQAGQSSATFAVGAEASDGAEFAESFTVTLTDSTNATVGTVTTTINDTSTNDVTKPVVTAGQAFSYVENSAANTLIDTVEASDNVAVTGFNIVSGNADGFFAIDATGNITLTAAGAAAAANDFEATPNTWTLGVTATDAAGNVSAATNVVLGEINVDDDKPVLSQAVIAGTTLTLTYNEALDPANLPLPTDFSVVAGGSTSVNVNSVTISGSTVTLALASTPSGAVTVAYTPNSNAAKVLQDLAGNDAAAFSGQTAVTDTTAPTLASSSPADNATNVAVGDNIVLTMSETVKAGTGNIVITNTNDATDTRTIDVTSSQVTFSGSTVTINPTADLKTGGHYVVTIGSGVIKDIAGNSFAGISGTALDFSTPGTSTTGQTFTLTTAIDAIPGLKGSLGTTDNSGNDTIIGEFATAPGNTLNASDQINGGDGTDILKMYGTYAAAQMPVTITNVETISLVNAAANAPLDFSGYTKAVSGVTTVMVENAAAMGGTGVAADKITTTAGQALSLGTGPTGAVLAGANLNWQASNTDTTLNLNFIGFQNATTGTVQNFAVAGTAATTLNISSTGAVNKVATFTGPTTVTSHVISGDKAFTYALAAADAAALNSIDASTSTGGVNADVSAAANKAGFTFTGGSGDDTITFKNAAFDTLLAGSQLSGGAGIDKIGLYDTTVSVAEAAKIQAASGFEKIGLNAAITLDASSLSNYKTFDIDTTALTQSITKMATGTTVNVGVGATAAFSATSLTLGGAVGVTDVTINLGGTTDGSTITHAIPTLDVTGLTNVKISSNGTAANTIGATALTMTDNTTFTLSGNADLTLATLTATATGSKVDGSAATGKLTLTGNTTAFAAGSALGDNLIGGSAADTIKASVNGGSLTGNGGNDTFNVSAALGGVGGATPTFQTTTITDFTKGDTITFAATAGAFSASKVDLSAAVSVAGALDLLAAGNNSDLKWGVYNGNTYIVDDVGAGATFAATDTMVQLTGVHDLSTSAFSGTSLTYA